jgi:hypothetical protein
VQSCQKHSGENCFQRLLTSSWRSRAILATSHGAIVSLQSSIRDFHIDVDFLKELLQQGGPRVTIKICAAARSEG